MLKEPVRYTTRDKRWPHQQWEPERNITTIWIEKRQYKKRSKSENSNLRGENKWSSHCNQLLLLWSLTGPYFDVIHSTLQTSKYTRIKSNVKCYIFLADFYQFQNIDEPFFVSTGCIQIWGSGTWIYRYLCSNPVFYCTPDTSEVVPCYYQTDIADSD